MRLPSVLLASLCALLASCASEPTLRQTGPPPDVELGPVLESMANKGLVMDMPYGDATYYLLMPGLIGFMEFSFIRRRADLPHPFMAGTAVAKTICDTAGISASATCACKKSPPKW